jgi:hypothetical protein
MFIGTSSSRAVKQRAGQHDLVEICREEAGGFDNRCDGDALLDDRLPSRGRRRAGVDVDIGSPEPLLDHGWLPGRHDPLLACLTAVLCPL